MVFPLSQMTFVSASPSSELSPEEMILILAARLKLTLGNASKLEAVLRSDINWQTLMVDSARLGVQPLLHKHLSQPKWSPYVPTDVLASLKVAYRKESFRNVRIYGLVEQLLKAFNDAGIGVVLLKGAFLGRWVYRDIGLRPMGDIDLLCREREASSVKAKLNELGFHQKTVYPSPLHERVYAIDRGWHLKPFYSSKSAMLEVHFSIFPNVPHGFAEMERVWQGVGQDTAEGLPVSFLSPSDLVLYLCLHLMHHLHIGRWQLYWFTDIHEVVSHYGDEMEWERLFESAATLGVTAQAKSILHLLSQHWDVSFPEVRGDFEGLSMAALLRDRLLGGCEERQKAVFRGQLNKIGMLADISGWRHRTYFLWKLVFPSRENLIGRYHPRNALTMVLSYLVHPLVMVKRTVLSLFYGVFCLVRKYTREG
jgi:hypothetical protein